MKLTRISVSSALFFLAFFAWLCWKVISASMFTYWLPDCFAAGVRLLCVFALLLSECMCVQGRLSHIFSLLMCLAVAIFVGLNAQNYEFVDLIVFVYCARNIELHSIAKCFAFGVALPCAVVVVSSQLGIIVDYIWLFESRLRHGLGFTYCTTLAHFYLSFVMAWCVIRYGRAGKAEAVALVLVDFWIFIMTDTRNPFLLTLLLVVLSWCIGKGLIRMGAGARKAVAAYLYIVFPCAILILAIVYNPADPILRVLNDVLSNRLIYSHNALETYSLSPFGQVPDIGIGYVGADGEIVDWWNHDANHLDSSFLRMLVYYGPVLLILVCALFFSLGLRESKRGNDLVCLLLFVNAVRGFIDPQLFQLQYDFLLLMLVPPASSASLHAQRSIVGNEDERELNYT